MHLPQDLMEGILNFFLIFESSSHFCECPAVYAFTCAISIAIRLVYFKKKMLGRVAKQLHRRFIRPVSMEVLLEFDAY